MALTKEIQELDPYGSLDDSKKKKDLFEVSKNDGPYGSPNYPIGASRKITQEELENMLGYIPYSNNNCEIVKNNGTDEENGIRLLNAVASCYAKTPNGLPLSNTNRAITYVLAGQYNLVEQTLELSEFVDIIGIGNSRGIVITGSSSAQTIKVLNNNNYSLFNLTIENIGVGKSLSHNSNQTDNGRWDNIVINTKIDTPAIWSGIYNNITAEVDNVMWGDIEGLVSNSSFRNNSCGYSPGSTTTISGNIIKCSALSNSFGSTGGGSSIISGIIEDCVAIDNSFGHSNEPDVDTYYTQISGSIKNCTARDKSFGYAKSGYVNISGLIENSNSRDYSFAHTDSTSKYVTILGVITNCTGRDYCFASRGGGVELASIQSIVIDCTGRDFCFGYSPTLTSGAILGTVENCNATSFGATSFGAGKLINCTGNYLRGPQAGEINRCNFINQSGSIVDVASISDSCVLRYSTFIQLEPTKDSIKIDSGASVKISHCELNQDFNLISGDPYTNLIYLPRNVIWDEKAEYFVSPYTSPDGFYHRFKKYVGTDGEFQTEDLGPV